MNRLIYTALSLILSAVAAWGSWTFLYTARTGDNNGVPAPDGQRVACLIVGTCIGYAAAYQLWRAVRGPRGAKTSHGVQ